MFREYLSLLTERTMFYYEETGWLWLFSLEKKRFSEDLTVALQYLKGA